MKYTVHGEFRRIGEKLPIPDNRTGNAMPSSVREFAELLAEIAIHQLRSQPNKSKGEHPHA